MTLTDYMCQEKKEEEDFTSIEDGVDALIQRLTDYVEKRGGRLITVTKSNTDNTRINRTEINRKQKCEENNSMDILSD